MSLRAALALEDVTNYAFTKACSLDDQLNSEYTRALVIRSDMHADDVVEIADTDPNPHRARNRMQARQWAASKMNPGKYSDRLDVNVTQHVDLNAALTAARARLRPVSDQRSDVIDLSPDESGTYRPSATDGESDADDVDIFS